MIPKTKMGSPSGEPERIQKALARAGVASRRAAEEMILQGRIRVNGRPVKELGLKVDIANDKVTVDGRPVRLQAEEELEKAYFLLNKPPNTLTTTKDDRGRKTVLDLIGGETHVRVYPVGRLDFDAEGALLITNDGKLAHQLTHPRFHVPKTYLAKVKGRPTEESLDKLRRGIYLDDGPTRPAHVELVEHTKANTWVEITVTEGRNRLIKRMFWRIRHPVARLIRVRFGNLEVNDLAPGRFRLLTKKEIADLKAWVK